jgi:hypothetical protein
LFNDTIRLLFQILILAPFLCAGSRDSAVGIATGYGLGGRGDEVRVPVGARIFSMSFRPLLGPTQPPIPMGTGGFFSGLKASGA